MIDIRISYLICSSMQCNNQTIRHTYVFDNIDTLRIFVLFILSTHAAVKRDAFHGQGTTSDVLYLYPLCSGSESSLSYCPYSRQYLKTSTCTHRDDVGVQCKGKCRLSYRICVVTVTSNHSGYDISPRYFWINDFRHMDQCSFTFCW